MSSSSLPTFTPGDYAKFFSAGGKADRRIITGKRYLILLTQACVLC
jgi:hypothetical protein